MLITRDTLVSRREMASGGKIDVSTPARTSTLAIDSLCMARSCSATWAISDRIAGRWIASELSSVDQRGAGRVETELPQRL